MRERLDWRFFLASLAGFLWCAWRAWQSEGWILDDELAHFLISAEVWEDPAQLWHSWSRPGRNLLQFWVTPLGLTAARFWTLALSFLAVGLTVSEARRLKLPGVWMIPLLLCFQWWFPELSYPVLTQAPFLLVWIAGIWLAARGYNRWAALFWGFLPLVRHEGIALAGLWGIWVIFGPQGFARALLEGYSRGVRKFFPRALFLGFLTFLPLIIMNVMTWITRKEVPILMFFESKPTEYYGSGPLWLYLQHLVTGAGVLVVLLAVLGLFWKKWPGWWKDWSMVLYLTYPAYLILHSLIYWQGLFASGGYYHFIMPMAPGLALWALAGLAVLREKVGPRVVAVVLVLVVWTGLAMPQQQVMVFDGHIPGLPEVQKNYQIIAPPMKESRFATGLREAGEWMRENADEGKWLAHHVAASWFLRDWRQGDKVDQWSVEEVSTLEKGSWVIWDVQYSKTVHHVLPDELEAAGWKERAAFCHGTVRVFRREEAAVGESAIRASRGPDSRGGASL